MTTNLNKNEKEAFDFMFDVPKSGYGYDDFDFFLRRFLLTIKIEGLSPDIDDAIDEVCTWIVTRSDEQEIKDLVCDIQYYVSGFTKCRKLVGQIMEMVNQSSDYERDGMIDAILPLRLL